MISVNKSMARLEGNGEYSLQKREMLDAVAQLERVKRGLTQDAESWDYELYIVKINIYS
jgi:hypothetical protein